MAKKLPTTVSDAPTDAELSRLLGGATRHWNAFHSHIGKTAPKVRVSWKFYKSVEAGGGWRCVVSDGKRNIVYMRPDHGAFLASFALSEQQILAAEAAGLPGSVVQSIREGPKLPEGRAARMEVRSPATLRIATLLLGVKLPH